MLLSARLLNNVANVNSFDYSTESRFTEGDALTIYLQLVDVNKDSNLKPAGRRYTPATGSTLQVTVQNLNSAKTLVKTATQPFTGDNSIWSFTVGATDGLKGTYTLQLQLTESSVITRGTVKNALAVESQVPTLL